MDVDERPIYQILELARIVHQTLGPGFVEGIYSRALVMELRCREFREERDKTIKVLYGDAVTGKHRLDLVIDDTVIIELLN